MSKTEGFLSRHVLCFKMILRLLLKRKCGLGLVPKPAFTYHKNITPDKINCAVASHVIVPFQMDADDDGSDIEF